jgi:hypothetical protein
MRNRAPSCGRNPRQCWLDNMEAAPLRRVRPELVQLPNATACERKN